MQVAVRVVDLLEVVDVEHQECEALVMAPRPLHLLQEPLRHVAAVRKLCQLVGQRVLLLRLVELGVADGHRRLGRDALQQLDLVLPQLARLGEVQLHRAHQLVRALDRHHQHVRRVAAAFKTRCMLGVQRGHQWTLRRHHRAQGLLVELAPGASRVVGQVVVGLPPHLRLAGSDQIHRAGDRAHQATGLGQCHVQHVAQRQRRVDRLGDGHQHVGALLGAALLGQDPLDLVRVAAQAQEQHQDDQEGDQKQRRQTERSRGQVHPSPPSSKTEIG